MDPLDQLREYDLMILTYNSWSDILEWGALPGGVVSYELRVVSYELRVDSYELRVDSFE